MQQVQLNEKLFKAAQRRAAANGFPSVDEYVADVLSLDLKRETDNYDALFTPQRLARIDQAAAQIKAGDCFTAEQVREHFEHKRASWSQKDSAR
jgi:hypothetical protein